jgi:DNA-directed RNA polymerase subunit RPC12/RpoP
MSNVNFTCPECGHQKLEEVMVDVTVASEVLDVDEDGNVEYGEQTNEDGEVRHYICAYCGWKVPRVRNGDALRKYLQAHGMLKEKR